MRFFGLGAKVMQKLGVSTQLLAAADIFPALERGVIDATEFSMPAMDIKLGFHQMAKFNYFPGWHQQVSCSEILMNKTGVRRAARQLQGDDRGRGQATRSPTPTPRPRPCSSASWPRCATSTRCRSSAGRDDELKAFEKAWLEVLAEESAKDPLFKKIADHYLDFRKKYAIWGDAQVDEADLPEGVSAGRL